MTITDVHFDEKIYPKPKEFIPERWLDDPKAPDGKSLDRYFVAFGKGPRLCLGIKYVFSLTLSFLCDTRIQSETDNPSSNHSLAYMELFLVLGAVFRRFRLNFMRPMSDVELVYDFFCHVRN